MISKVHGSGVLFRFEIQLLVIGILVEGRGCVISGNPNCPLMTPNY